MFEGLSRAMVALRSRAPAWRAPAVAALAALAAVSVAACGGDDAGGTAPAAGDATVSLQDMPGYGDVLVTSAGDPVYVSSGDPRGGSACTGKCAETWKPLTAEGKPTAGPDVDAGSLSTMKRDDGATQVLYNDRALYTHQGEGLAAGKKQFGGSWYFVDQHGEPVSGTAAGGY